MRGKKVFVTSSAREILCHERQEMTFNEFLRMTYSLLVLQGMKNKG